MSVELAILLVAFVVLLWVGLNPPELLEDDDPTVPWVCECEHPRIGAFGECQNENCHRPHLGWMQHPSNREQW